MPDDRYVLMWKFCIKRHILQMNSADDKYVMFYLFFPELLEKIF